MGKTADMTMVQKTIIDTLHKEDKSQKVITERGGCLQSATSKNIKSKVDWKEETGVWRKTGEAQNPSSVKFLKSVMIWGAVTSAGVGLLCFIKSKVNAAIYPEILEHFILPSADKLYGDADFLFQQDFSTCPQCKATSKWFADHDITVLYGPANMPDLNPIENLWDIFKKKMRNSRSKNIQMI
ncbi:hypothetical protein M9458_057637 [Cirrhinus mrigala]|uniref:Tc1-like transposase DDE domain-containing protein n=1 Tax=Cirrhinus mrigala TaxID=683832 RepID=A0ABD0MAW5_CIRMR